MTMLCLLILTSCSISNKGTIAITKPIRTIENIGSEKEGQLKQADIPKIIAIARLTNDTSADEAGVILRAVLQSQLSNKNFQLIHSKEYDLKNPDNNLSPEQMAKILGADAILTGTVTDFKRTYAGIYAQIKLGVKIQLISKEGKELWQEEKSITSRAGGISTTPWGLLLNAALAALHLEDKNLFAAADELGRSIAVSFPEPVGYVGSPLPNLDMVIHDGANKWLKYGDKLSLAIKGQQGLRAIVDVEGIGSFDLKEQQPGYYYADIDVDKRWNGDQKVVTGKLVDARGQITTKLSTTGLVNFDNLAPSNVTDVVVEFATPKEIKLAWNKEPHEKVSYEITLQSAQKTLMIKATDKNSITLSGQFQPFEPLNISVVALDKAKNKSFTTNIQATVYPLKLSHITQLSSVLSGRYSGTSLLSKSNSPYVVANKVVFPQTSTLLVEPGVVIKFKQAANITVKGRGYFWGQKNKPIYLTNESKLTPSKKFLVVDSANTVELAEMIINDAGIGLDVKAGEVVADHLTVKNSKYSAINMGGNAKVKLINCQLSGSSTSAIVVSGRSRLQLLNCVFSENSPFHIQNASPFAIKAKNVTFDKSAVRAVLGKIKLEN